MRAALGIITEAAGKVTRFTRCKPLPNYQKSPYILFRFSDAFGNLAIFYDQVFGIPCKVQHL